ncbi:hypothetical protein JTB14_021832 [Gonioctena quinquepunctata]|nr:hypothetical protein JTB14_021832 [Gonioctena quinquepunctata]
MSQSERDVLRKTNRLTAGIPPLRYSPNEENAIASKKSVRSKSFKSSTSKRLKEIELKKLEAINKPQEEFDQRKLQRQIAVIEAQASLDLEVHENYCEETKSMQSENFESDSKKEVDSIEKTQSAHEKVNSWLLKEKLIESAQGSNAFIPSEEYYSQVVNNPTTKIIKEFTTATQAMTQAFKSISDPSKMPFRKVVGKELPLFYGNVEDWPMFISLYRRSTETCKFTDEENMLRLQKALKNEALEAVKSLFISPENLEDIIQTLETRFGRPEFIIDSMTNKVKLMPPVNTRYPLSLIKFANSVLNLTVTAQSLKMEAYINNPQLLSQLVQKLPEHLQFQWARIIVDKEKAITIPTLREFSEWLQKESSAASLLCKPSTSSFTSSDRYSERKPKNTVLVGSEETLDRRNCIFCSESGHPLYHCQKFLSLEVDGRWDWVKNVKFVFHVCLLLIVCLDAKIRDVLEYRTVLNTTIDYCILNYHLRIILNIAYKSRMVHQMSMSRKEKRNLRILHAV